MGYLPSKDTQFTGTEQLVNLTALAGGTIDLDAAASVLVPTVTANGAGTEAISDAAMGTYVAAQIAAGGFATTTQLDAAIAGLDIKASVRLATTGAITLASRTSSTLTTAAGTLTIDGSAVVNGDRILVKDTPTGGSSTAGDTGIFVVSGVGSTVVLTRTSDADTWTEIVGALVTVEIGSTNADRAYLCTADAGGTLGTTAQSWTQFGAGTTVATGISTTPAGNLAATNVQTSLAELDSEKVAKAGDTVTGALLINYASPVFEVRASSGSAIVEIDAATGSSAQLQLKVNNALRGYVTASATATALGNDTLDAISISSANNVALGNATGTLTSLATDPASTDSSTKVPTTAWVQKSVRAKNYVAVANASFPYTITASGSVPNVDVVVTQQTAISKTVTLPAANAVSAGTVITVKDGSTSGAATYPLAINRAGADTIDGLTSFTLDTNLQSVDLMSDGTSKWWVI